MILMGNFADFITIISTKIIQNMILEVILSKKEYICQDFVDLTLKKTFQQILSYDNIIVT